MRHSIFFYAYLSHQVELSSNVSSARLLTVKSNTWISSTSVPHELYNKRNSGSNIISGLLSGCVKSISELIVDAYENKLTRLFFGILYAVTQ